MSLMNGLPITNVPPQHIVPYIWNVSHRHHGLGCAAIVYLFPLQGLCLCRESSFTRRVSVFSSQRLLLIFVLTTSSTHTICLKQTQTTKPLLCTNSMQYAQLNTAWSRHTTQSSLRRCLPCSKLPESCVPHEVHHSLLLQSQRE